VDWGRLGQRGGQKDDNRISSEVLGGGGNGTAHACLFLCKIALYRC